MDHPFDRAAEDLGNIVHLEHVNITIPDQRLATLFYITGLGLTRDPYIMTGIGNMWVNAGRSQFHLPQGEPQIVRGHIGLVLPDRDALRRRLDSVRRHLDGTRFAVSEQAGAIEVTCPWGNRIRCHTPQERFGAMALGLAYVAFDVPSDTADNIATFYREAIGAPAVVAADGEG